MTADPPDATLDALPPLREVITRHGLRAEKKLGQNFLLDANITDKIVRATTGLDHANVIEVGPGPGGLTRSLLRGGARHVTAVEYDPRAVAALADLQCAAGGRLDVRQDDALAFDYAVVAAPRWIVANLPYNIATPLLTGWLRRLRDDPGFVAGMALMFQREVADRITARTGEKSYGRLAVICQWLCATRRVFDIPGSAFVPPPKVTSSVVLFQPRTLSGPQPAFATVEAITAAAFGQRRKMLRTSLAGYASELGRLAIDPTLRAEQLPPDDFVRIALEAEKRTV